MVSRGSSRAPNGVPYPNTPMASLRLTSAGLLLHALLGLDEIEPAERDRVRDELVAPLTESLP